VWLKQFRLRNMAELLSAMFGAKKKIKKAALERTACVWGKDTLSERTHDTSDFSRHAGRSIERVFFVWILDFLIKE
jgi:hypothetical protein